MKTKLTNIQQLAAVVITLPVATLASYVILEILFYWFMGELLEAPEIDELLYGITYWLVSFMLGIVLTIFTWRNVAQVIARTGIPGLVPANEEPEDEKSQVIETVQVYLEVFVKDKGSEIFKSKPFFHGTFSMERIWKTLFGNGKPKVNLVRNDRKRLTLARPEAFKASEGIDEKAIFVKFSQGGRVFYHFETLAGDTGTYNEQNEQDYASCKFQLVHIGCDSSMVTGFLTITGTKANMRNLFFRKKK